MQQNQTTDSRDAACPLPAVAVPALTTFYNGACPVCRAEMTKYRGDAEARGLPLVFQDVAEDGREAAALGLTPDRALRRLHARDAEGRLHVGFDAMLAVWRALPRTRWMSRFFGLPLIRPVSAWLYEHVVSATLYRWAQRRLARAERAAG